MYFELCLKAISQYYVSFKFVDKKVLTQEQYERVKDTYTKEFFYTF